MQEKLDRIEDCSDQPCECGMMETPKEELYIGCKIIKAISMTSDEFKKLKGKEIGIEENCDGYKVEYEDGYVSWSPAWTFLNAYRKLSNGEKKLLTA